MQVYVLDEVNVTYIFPYMCLSISNYYDGGGGGGYGPLSAGGIEAEYLIMKTIILQ